MAHYINITRASDDMGQSMRSGAIEKSKSESTSQDRGATSNKLEELKAMPAVPPERDIRSRQSKVYTPDILSAVERKNDAGKPERERIRMRVGPIFGFSEVI